MTGLAAAQSGPVVGVSWSNFQEERWKTDEAAIVAAVEAAGGSYISADAQSSSQKQLPDVESLIDILLRISRFAADFPRIQEMDLNPVFSFGPGAGSKVVDVRIRLAEEGAE